MIFALLDEVIVVYIEPILIYIGGFSFKEPFPNFIRMVFGKGPRL